MKLLKLKGRIVPQRHRAMRESPAERGLLAIRLVKFALLTDLEFSLGDAERMEIRRAWWLSKKLFDADEIEAFGELLRHYGD